MSNTQELVTAVLVDIATLKSQLAAKEKELAGYRDELRKLLGSLDSGSAKGAAPKGRPPGPRQPGAINVSQSVLAFMAVNAKVDGPGLSRADILKQFPDRDAAVHAALRVHQQAGRLFNTTDHRWYYADPQPQPLVVETAPVDVVVHPQDASAVSNDELTAG